MASPPTGTVTFLFTDIEGSTKLWEQHPDAMRSDLARLDALLRHAIAAHSGQFVVNSPVAVLPRSPDPRVVDVRQHAVHLL